MNNDFSTDSILNIRHLFTPDTESDGESIINSLKSLHNQYPVYNPNYIPSIHELIQNGGLSKKNVIKGIRYENNDNASVGGGDGDTNEEIRQNSLAMYPTQLRTITNDDYIIRTLSLPPKYGLISKAFVTQDMGISVNYPTDLLATQNPNAVTGTRC